jgi:hypothetical protein
MGLHLEDQAQQQQQLVGVPDATHCNTFHSKQLPTKPGCRTHPTHLESQAQQQLAGLLPRLVDHPSSYAGLHAALYCSHVQGTCQVHVLPQQGTVAVGLGHLSTVPPGAQAQAQACFSQFTWDWSIEDWIGE